MAEAEERSINVSGAFKEAGLGRVNVICLQAPTRQKFEKRLYQSFATSQKRKE
jgi:hypothetical protein